jgi:hypothetical protein
MSHPTASSSSNSCSNFQLIINNALKVYEKRTKKDLLAHPLATQLQTCDSPAAILAVLQQQLEVGGLDQSRSGDDRWTKWLDPTVNVLFALSATVGAGVSLVCPENLHVEFCTLIFFLQVFSPASVVFAGIGILLSVCIYNSLAWANLTHTFIRRPRMFGQAKALLWTSLSTSKGFFDVSRFTQKCRRPRK